MPATVISPFVNADGQAVVDLVVDEERTRSEHAGDHLSEARRRPALVGAFPSRRGVSNP